MSVSSVELALVISSEGCEVESIREKLPFGDVKVVSKRAAGIGAEELAQQILISVAGAFTYEQLKHLMIALKNVLAEELTSRTVSKRTRQVDVLFDGLSYALSDDADIQELIADIEILIQEKNSD